MWSIFKKEINSFFSSLVGYIAIFVFLLAMSLFMWVFPDTNVLDYGFAVMDTMFVTAPWVFMFLIPAITMRSFSEEIQSGTYELLATRPVREIEIILGKYFASLALFIFALLPTLIYFYTISRLGAPPGNLDTGAIWGSYLGLLFLGGAFVAIGIFASSVTSNQIVAFVLALSLCFLIFIAFDFFSSLPVFYAKVDDIVESLGINAHYNSISRGVVDTRDIIYFLTIIAAFILFTKTALESRKW